MNDDTPLIDWPEEGITRSPYTVMVDPEVYRLEQERIFAGPVWNYLCMEAEIPNGGDFVSVQVGDTPVVVVRDRDGGINAIVNRCAHKGSLLCAQPCGNRDSFTCVYHGWNYDLKGTLRSVAFQRGVGGKGGMPEDFSVDAHNLDTMRVEVICGLVFATFSEEVEDFETYAGPSMVAHMKRLLDRPVEVLGYHHQYLHNNWKLYMENTRDPYHATILHAFYATFKLNRLSMEGGVALEHDGWHNLLYSSAGRDASGEYEGASLRSIVAGVGLEDPAVTTRRQEFADGLTIAIQSIFPTFVTQQIYNTLAIRHMVPLGPTECELHWTFFGYRDDDEDLRQMRFLQSNLIGPAGYVSMEDGSVGNYVQRGIAGVGQKQASLMVLGGHDVVNSPGVRATETSLRGFWSGYRTLMGV